MFTIIPFILIVLALAIIIVVIVRKFPELSLLDVDNLPEVKEGKKKDEYFKKRAQSKMQQKKAKRSVKIKSLHKQFKGVQSKFRSYVGQVEKAVKQESKKKEIVMPKRTEPAKEKNVSEVKTLLKEANNAMLQEDFEIAEKKYISAIRVDKMNKEAYRGLGDVYAAQKQYNEAAETYSFLIQIDPKNDSVAMKLAELYESQGKTEEAVEYYQKAVLINPHLPTRFAKLASLLEGIGEHETALEAIEQAVELEPQNPKYLDMLVEISIMVEDKSGAKDALHKLRMVNPDNQKIRILQDKIRQMKDDE